MGFLKGAGKLAWGATKLTAKATVATAGLAYKGAKATAKLGYDHREKIGAAAATTTIVAAKAASIAGKAAYKATTFTAKTTYEHRKTIAGTAVGVVRGTTGALRDASGHLVSKESISAQVRMVEGQSRRYHQLTSQFNDRLRIGRHRKAVLLDTLVVGGDTLGTYVNSGKVPDDILQAYNLAYPGVAATRSFATEVGRLDGQELVGFVSGVKGKLFEVQYAKFLNDGHLPSGYHAQLASSPTNPSWDIAITGPSGQLHDTIQAKVTDSVTYVTDALKQNPQIDVVTTSEVHSHLVMQGFSEHVIDSGISDAALTAAVEGGVDGATISMHWVPSTVSLALIAFSAYSQEGLSSYQKSRQFGQRASRSYLAYLAGGGLAVVTNTWWIGVLGGMGSRMILGTGRRKRERLAELKQLVHSNQGVLRRLERQLA